MGYCSHEAKFPLGENSSAVATNLVDESLHFDPRLLVLIRPRIQLER